MIKLSTLALLMLAAFLVGCAVMSLEMLASRYLNPYFGGTIFTWAALISVVLLAMMGGYFLGGYSADKLKVPAILEIMICLAALYMLALPLFVDQLILDSERHAGWGTRHRVGFQVRAHHRVATQHRQAVPVFFVLEMMEAVHVAAL